MGRKAPEAALLPQCARAPTISNLGNGDPLLDNNGKLIKSENVPRGRGPFKSWENGAIDAQLYERFISLKDWSLAAALFRWEKYNGFGPRWHGMPTGYPWAGTSVYRGVKYVMDQWAKDAQPGCAAMLRGLIDAGHLATIDDGTIISASPANVLPPVLHIRDGNRAVGRVGEGQFLRDTPFSSALRHEAFKAAGAVPCCRRR